MKKVLIIVGVVILGIILILVLIGAYLGVVPGLSKLFVKQVDLGVASSEGSDLVLYEEIGLTGDALSVSNLNDKELVYSGEKELEKTFSSDEMSSMLSGWGERYYYTPVKNVQVKVSEDGTVEFSAILIVDRAVSLAKMLGYTDEQIDAAQKYAKFVSNEIPFYGKGTGGAKNNQVTVNADTLKAGNISLPEEYKDEVNGAIEDAIERRIEQIDGFYAEEASFSGGGMDFVGTIPTSVEIAE